MTKRLMKDTNVGWVRDIPQHWDSIRGKYIFTNRKSVVGAKVDDYERLALTLNGVIRRSKDDNEGLQPTEFSGYQILKENELVFKLIDLQNVSTSRVGLSKYTGIVSPAYVVLKTSKKVYPSFAEKYYLMMWMYEVFNALGDAGVRSNLNAKELLELRFPLPPYEEQIKIADYLDSKCSEIDNLSKDIEHQIETLEEYKKSVITEAVTKGLNPNVEMNDSDVPWIEKYPKEWQISEISFYTTSRSGGTPDRLNMDYWNGGTIPWMASGEVNKIFVTETNEKITKLATRNSSAKIVPANSVMVALNGQGKTKGMSAILKIDATCNQSLCAFKCDEVNLNYEYLFFCFQCMYKYLRGQAGDAIRDGLSASYVKKQRIPLPSFDEQLEISKFCMKKYIEIDSIITDKKKQLDTLTEYKKSLIYEYVTGKKEVIV